MTKRGRGQRRSRRLKNRSTPIRWITIAPPAWGLANAMQLMNEMAREVISTFGIPEWMLRRAVA